MRRNRRDFRGRNKPRKEKIRKEIKKELNLSHDVILGLKKNRIYVKGMDTKNYRYRLVNDDRGGMDVIRMQELGYEVVSDNSHVMGQRGDVGSSNSNLGSGYSQYVGLDYQGKPMNGILMRVPKEQFQALQAYKQEEQDAIMERIHPDTMIKENPYLKAPRDFKTTIEKDE